MYPFFVHVLIDAYSITSRLFKCFHALLDTFSSFFLEMRAPNLKILYFETEKVTIRIDVAYFSRIFAHVGRMEGGPECKVSCMIWAKVFHYIGRMRFYILSRASVKRFWMIPTFVSSQSNQTS